MVRAPRSHASYAAEKGRGTAASPGRESQPFGRRPANDRRAVALTLTQAGEAHQAALLERRNEALAAILSEVSTKDRVALERIVEAMLTRLPHDAVSALNVCRFCDAARCADCPMDVFGPLASSRR